MSYDGDFQTFLAERDSLTYTQASGLFEAFRALRPLARDRNARNGLEVWCTQVAGDKLREALSLPRDRMNEAASLFGEGQAFSNFPITIADFVQRMQGEFDDWQAAVLAKGEHNDV